MTKEDIIRMAREAGWTIGPATLSGLERFAALVAAAEREACAKVCEDSVEYAGDTIAAAIRARGNT